MSPEENRKRIAKLRAAEGGGKQAPRSGAYDPKRMRAEQENKRKLRAA